MSSGELKGIELRSGVNDKLEGFCTVVVNGGDLLGQLTPDEVRAMALQWLEVAEAAHMDQTIVKVMMDTMGCDLENALAFLAMCRDAR